MSKSIQLFILPFAGGAASAFRELEGLLSENIDVHTIEYPGRGTRTSEVFCQSMDELIEDAAVQIKELRNPEIPFSLMGYSMGVEVAFDLAQYKLDEKPEHLFFCARETIDLDTKGHDFALLDKEEFAKKIIAFGGINPEIVENKRFLNIYLKPVYEDYKLLREYQYHPEYGTLTNNLTILYCEKDIPQRDVMGWSMVTTGDTRFYEMGNNHFFINDCANEMADIINREILM